ncbi:MAG: hypothetical protein HY913_14405 [Desulfomonile tiedjei]|nr:hypothetical protein [Desulfomonile tiedjei]
MVHIDLNDEQADMLEHVVENYLSELTSEISNTEKLSFREDLKREKAFLLDFKERITKKAA